MTATKSLFNALAADRDLVQTVTRSSDALRRMNLRFPERTGANSELLGYEAAAEGFRACADRPVEANIEHLVELGDDWAAGVRPDDHVTFVVLRVI